MTIDKEKIRAAAMAATQGEWSNYKTVVYLPNVYGGFDLHDMPNPNNNATHIATSNPATVLSLLDALDKAEKDRDVLIQQLLKCRDFFEIDWVNPGNVAEFTLREIYSTLRSMKGGE